MISLILDVNTNRSTITNIKTYFDPLEILKIIYLKRQ